MYILIYIYVSLFGIEGDIRALFKPNWSNRAYF